MLALVLGSLSTLAYFAGSSKAALAASVFLPNVNFVSRCCSGINSSPHLRPPCHRHADATLRSHAQAHSPPAGTRQRAVLRGTEQLRTSRQPRDRKGACRVFRGGGGDCPQCRCPMCRRNRNCSIVV